MHGKDYVGLVGNNDLLSQKILFPTFTRFKPSRLQLESELWGKGLQYTQQQHRWAQGFCEPRMADDEESLRQEDLQNFWPRLERVIATKDGHIE